jgi:hypothetical protein
VVRRALAALVLAALAAAGALAALALPGARNSLEY